MIDNWYQLTGEATAEKLKTSPKDGLTRKAARTAMRKHGKNEIYPVSKITFFNVLKAEGFFNAAEPYVLSFEVKPWADEDADIVLAGTKRVINRAWALCE